jgi:hypothetical protein
MNNIENQTQNTQAVPQDPVVQPQVVKPLPKENAPVNPIEEGLNLIPSMTEEEKVVEKTKSTVSIGSVLSFIVLVGIIIVVVGFNIVTKQILNGKKDNLYAIEKRVNQQADKIISNDAIVDRAVLYAKVKEGAFSHKAIIDFLTQIGSKIGNIQVRRVMISEDLSFSYVGYTTDLETVSKLWYTLGTDENIDNINLQSVAKGENQVTFSFEGVLNNKNFSNK